MTVRKKRIPWNKGKHYAKHYICPVCHGDFCPGRKNQKTCSIECAAKLRPRPSASFSGGKHSIKTRRKMSLVRIGIHTGKKHPNWKGGITPLNRQLRQSKEYLNWRSDVFERDNYTCQKCSKHGGQLEAHHIIPFRVNRTNYNVDNGLTLCKPCHRSLERGSYKKKVVK